MSERFIKFIPSEEAFWLLHNKPNAFRLLTHIANTARRQNGYPDGLTIGQCHLQHWTKYKLTEREYRSAKSMLVLRKHIEISATCRTRQKSTTGTTTVSTLVRLISSTVYDINPEENDDPNDDRATTERRPSDDKQEGIRKKKNEKEENPQPPFLTPLPEKKNFREFVTLTQTEYDTLLAKHGQSFLEKMLDALDSFKGSSGKVYKSDYHTMKDGGWVVQRVNTEILKSKGKDENPFKPSQGSFKSPEPKFQSSRVIRGSNVIEGD